MKCRKNKSAIEKIDIVLLWVDGSDEKWLSKKEQFKTTKSDNNTTNRFRDWGLLKYWFRGIEQNAPWINKIYLVTDNQVPNWLNLNNEKISIVDHTEIIPKKYLPTFNTNVIHYYIDNIPGLSEKYILFDDDMYVLKKLSTKDFYRGDKIVEEYAEERFSYGLSPTEVYPHELLNNMQYINGKYEKYKSYRKNIFKYINLKYGIKNTIKTLLNMPFKKLSGIYSPHVCQAYTKKHMNIFKNDLKKEIEESSGNKFRSKDDFTRLAVRNIALMEGDFYPRSHSFSKRYELSTNNKKLYAEIIKPKHKIICINDSNNNYDYEEIKKQLIALFDKKYPNPSKFELEQRP